MKQEQLIVLAVFAVVLLGISGNLPFALWPSLYSTWRYWYADNIGIHGNIVETSNIDQAYSIMTFRMLSSTDANGAFPVYASNFDALGNGICVVKQCPNEPETPTIDESRMADGTPIYYAQAGIECEGYSNYTLYSFHSIPSGLYTAQMKFAFPLKSTTLADIQGPQRSAACNFMRTGENVYGATFVVTKTFSATTPVCGNNVCETGEASSCPQDCVVAPYCGDGTCNNGETTLTCVADCPSGVCSDGTANGACSTVSVGLKCTNGVLASDAVCNVAPPPTPTIWQMIQNFITWLLHLFGVG